MALFDDLTSLLTGVGNNADYVQATGGSGSSYVANQTAADIADNGQVSSSGGTTTIAPPNWLSSLTSLVNAGTNAATVVAPIINGKASATPANPAATPTKTGTVPATATYQAAKTSNTMLWILGGLAAAAAAVGIWFLARKR